MTKSEFISRLEYRLSGIPEVERKEAIQYYLNYFEDAGIENEEKVMKELESPEKVAEQIISDYREGNPTWNRSTTTSAKSFFEEHKALAIVLIVIAAICTMPVWSGVAGALLGIICGCLGVLIAIAAIGVAGVVGGVVLLIVGTVNIFSNFGLFLLLSGFGLLFITVGLLALLATLWIGWKLIPWLVDKISGLVHRKRENKEEGVA